MTKDRQFTGGVKEFSHPGYDLEDTDSSKEFKKSLLLKYFYDDPFDMTNVAKLKKHVKFYTLKISVKNTKFKIIISKDKKEFLKDDADENYEIELPSDKYEIIIEKKIFLFLKKQKKIIVVLDKDKKIELVL